VTAPCNEASLLIEITAQPCQLVLVAQLGGGDHLVMRRRKGLVVEAGRQIGHRPVGAHGQHPFVAHAIGIVVGKRVQIVAIFRLAVLALAFGLLAAGLGAGVAVARLFLALVAFLIALVGGLLLVLAAFVGRLLLVVRLDQREMLQQACRELLESALIVERERQRVEIAARLGLDPFAHQLHARPRGLRRGISGQALAHQQRHGGGKRHLVHISRPRDRIGLEAQIERISEIVVHSRHCASADRLDPRLLGGIIDGAGHRVRGRMASMQRGVMMAKLERAGIGEAPRERHLIARQGAARARHLDRLARKVWRVRRERDLDLRVARHRACRARQNRLEGIERGLLTHNAGLRDRTRQVKPGRILSRIETHKPPVFAICPGLKQVRPENAPK
jgi:hypothetical protein